MRISEFVNDLLGEEPVAKVFSLFTPPQAEDRSLPVRLLLSGGGILVFGVGLLSAATSATMLLLSIGIVYYLMTQILGVRVELDLDPLTQYVRRSQRAPAAPN